ncbi:hypothetical protein PsYK624_071970 [Phanerochaete sordida]|uniref:Uncharacterized protein n=1 Tax=Phanerochaete sordida TaxID=48140 RepID=A0A9P3GAZ5_9APHY|nr:hypothetical protein PsYK624_071540 [Phanerochaete sordida]GJE91049.1 hypothetical protein PsYK624_071970 [Phanerochaete sordida]
MPAKSWFESPTEQDWLVQRIRQDGAARPPNLKKYADAVAAEFVAEFPGAAEPLAITKRGRFQRMESPEECADRRGKRPKRCSDWIQNHWAKYTGTSQAPPSYIALKEYPAEPKVGRAKSALDLFKSENPQIAAAARETAIQDGLDIKRDWATITTRVNTAFADALKSDPRREYYYRRSQDDKDAKAAERRQQKAQQETEEQDEDLMSPRHRNKTFNDLEYTIHTFITKIASQTNTEIFIMFGGQAGNGSWKKYIMTNRAGEENDFGQDVQKSRHPGFGILDAFDQHLKRVRAYDPEGGIMEPATQSSPASSLPSHAPSPIVPSPGSPTSRDQAPQGSPAPTSHTQPAPSPTSPLQRSPLQTSPLQRTPSAASPAQRSPPSALSPQQLSGILDENPAPGCLLRAETEDSSITTTSGQSTTCPPLSLPPLASVISDDTVLPAALADDQLLPSHVDPNATEARKDLSPSGVALTAIPTPVSPREQPQQSASGDRAPAPPLLSITPSQDGVPQSQQPVAGNKPPRGRKAASAAGTVLPPGPLSPRKTRQDRKVEGELAALTTKRQTRTTAAAVVAKSSLGKRASGAPDNTTIPKKQKKSGVRR